MNTFNVGCASVKNAKKFRVVYGDMLTSYFNRPLIKKYFASKDEMNDWIKMAASWRGNSRCYFDYLGCYEKIGRNYVEIPIEVEIC